MSVSTVHSDCLGFLDAVTIVCYAICKLGGCGFRKLGLIVFSFCSKLSGEGGWHRPIVLVGHSLGGIVMKHLVVELDRKAQSLPNLSDRKEIDRAKVSKSFLECLRGCFSYSVPHGGLVVTKDLRLVTNVFGEFISEESLRVKFFQDLSMGSKSLEKLSAEFAEADRYGSDADNVGQIKLSALLEGKNFTGVSTCLDVGSAYRRR